MNMVATTGVTIPSYRGRAATKKVHTAYGLQPFLDQICTDLNHFETLSPLRSASAPVRQRRIFRQIFGPEDTSAENLEAKIRQMC
jgi:hypothetical protein